MVTSYMQQELEQQQRFRVTPLHVIQVEKKRGRRRLQGVHDTLKKALLLPGLGHVARLWKDRRFEEFPEVFNLVERLHVEGNKKVVDHVVFYFTELLYIELQKHGINPRFAERRLGPVSCHWLEFLKRAFGWN